MHKGRSADQSGGGLVVDAAELGNHGDAGECRLLTDAADGSEQTLISTQIDALTYERQHHLVDLFVIGDERFAVGLDRQADVGKARRIEPAGLRMDHVFELFASICELVKCFTYRIFRQFDVMRFAASHIVGSRRISCKQASIRSVGFGLVPTSVRYALKREG